MANYDEKILQEYANKMYLKADRIVLLYALAGGAIGAIAGILYYDMMWGDFFARNDPNKGALSFVLAVVGLIVGGFIGQRRAFFLRFKAQLALCQRQIELNTRKQHLENDANGTLPPTTEAK